MTVCSSAARSASGLPFVVPGAGQAPEPVQVWLRAIEADLDVDDPRGDTYAHVIGLLAWQLRRAARDAGEISDLDEDYVRVADDELVHYSAPLGRPGGRRLAPHPDLDHALGVLFGLHGGPLGLRGVAVGGGGLKGGVAFSAHAGHGAVQLAAHRIEALDQRGAAACMSWIGACTARRLE
jgi:hypothetical protein